MPLKKDTGFIVTVMRAFFFPESRKHTKGKQPAITRELLPVRPLALDTSPLPRSRRGRGCFSVQSFVSAKDAKTGPKSYVCALAVLPSHAYLWPLSEPQRTQAPSPSTWRRAR